MASSTWMTAIGLKPWSALVIATVAALALHACSSTAPSGEPSGAESTPASSAATDGPPTSSGLMPTGSPSVAPSAGSVDWGPLAVALDDARDDLDAGAGPGRLRLGPTCVTYLVEETGIAVTLIWRSGQTRWDGPSRQILFNDRDHGLVALADGARLDLSGAPLMEPDSPDQGAAQPVWIIEPDPSCPPARWVVHQVDPAGG